MPVGSTENLRIILTAVDNATRVLKGVSSSVSNTQKSLDKATAGSKKFTKAVGLMAAVGGGLAVREFASFEKQMSKVKAITNANSEEFAQMTALAKKMGATTAFTGKEAGDALEFLGMAGLSVKESMAALPGALELAAAGNLTLGESADIATNIMAQFGIKAENIGRVNDVLAKSATSANTSVQEMAEAMKYLGPVANTFKIPIEEGAAAVNILANNGIKGSMAGRAFASSLLRITKPTDNMKDSMEALNISLFDQQGQYVGLTDTVKQLQEGTKGMTDEQKAMHVTTVFGMQATKHWLTLMKEGSGELETYTTSLENSEGAAKKMAETQLDNLAGSFTLLKSAVSGAMIEIGGAISVHLRPAIDWLTEALGNWRQTWEDLGPVMQSVIKAVGLVAGGMAAIALVVGTVSLVLTPIIAAFGFLVTVLTSLGTILGFVGAAFVAVGAPIVLLIASIMALGAVIYAFYKNWDDIMLVIKYLTQKMKDKVVQIWEDFKADIFIILEAIGNWISKKWESIKTATSNFLTSIKNWFSEKFNFIKDLVITVLTFIGDRFKASFNFYKNIVVGAFNIIKAIFTGDTAYLKNIISNVLNTIKNIWSGAMSTMKNVGIGAWNAIKGGVVNVIDGLLGKFTAFQTRVSAIYSKVSGWVKSIFSSESKAQASASRTSSIAGARAIGGAVSRNKTYLVGENGPEYFTPGTTGRIQPNGSGGGGGQPLSLNFGDVHISNGQDEATFFQKVEKAVVEIKRKADNGYA